MRTLVAALWLMTSLSTAQAKTRPVADLTAGDYPLLVSVLGQEGYASQSVRKLANPRLLWLDYDWMSEHGFYDAREIVNNKAFEDQVLATLAWATPIEGENLSDYRSEEQTFYADRYGGGRNGIGGNRGSGRAASKGMIQTKGIGRTSLMEYGAKALADVEHSTGRCDLFEGITETVVSQIAHSEMPFGANRVIALIDTGITYYDSYWKAWIPRVLIVREDPLRPAHFMANDANIRTQIEQRRLQFVMQTLPDALTRPKGMQAKDRLTRLHQGIEFLIDCHARVSAFSYANRFLHGAFSPSNEELSCAALDFGAFMGLEGYARAGRPSERELNGDTTAVENVLRAFFSDLNTYLPANDRKEIPSVDAAIAEYKQKHDQYTRREFVLLTGVPPELLSGFNPSTLGGQLWAMAEDGNEHPLDALSGSVGRTGAYDLGRILKNLVFTMMMNSDTALDSEIMATQFERAIAADILDVPTRKTLIKSYQSLMHQILKSAESEGITRANLVTYMSFATELRNRRSPHLIGDAVRDSYWTGIYMRFLKDRNIPALRTAMNKAIDESRSRFADAKPFTLVLSQSQQSPGHSTREIFDLKTGKRQLEAVGAASPAGQCETLLAKRRK